MITEKTNSVSVLLLGFLWISPLSLADGSQTNLLTTPQSSENVSASGKYAPPTENQAPPKTLAETEAALKDALGVRQTGPDTFSIGKVNFNKKERTVTFPARVNLRDQVCEYALVSDMGKKHESMFATESRPDQVHIACLLLGLTATNLNGALNHPHPVPASNAVKIEVSWKSSDQPVKHALSELIVLKAEPTPTSTPDNLSIKPFPAGDWLYNGSKVGPGGFQAQAEGSFISLIRDDVALINNPFDNRDNDRIHYPNEKLLPPVETPVEIVLRFGPQPK